MAARADLLGEEDLRTEADAKVKNVRLARGYQERQLKP